jgi:hypothetical protein
VIRTRSPILWWLALALLLGPALGHMHRVVHGPQTLAPPTQVDAQQPHAHRVADLFAAHDDDSSCRLFDQLTHSDALPGLPAVVLPLLLTPFLFRRIERDAVARRAALFDARGPPALR